MLSTPKKNKEIGQVGAVRNFFSMLGRKILAEAALVTIGSSLILGTPQAAMGEAPLFYRDGAEAPVELRVSAMDNHTSSPLKIKQIEKSGTEQSKEYNLAIGGWDIRARGRAGPIGLEYTKTTSGDSYSQKYGEVELIQNNNESVDAVTPFVRLGRIEIGAGWTWKEFCYSEEWMYKGKREWLCGGNPLKASAGGPNFVLRCMPISLSYCKLNGNGSSELMYNTEALIMKQSEDITLDEEIFKATLPIDIKWIEFMPFYSFSERRDHMKGCAQEILWPYSSNLTGNSGNRITSASTWGIDIFLPITASSQKTKEGDFYKTSFVFKLGLQSRSVSLAMRNSDNLLISESKQEIENIITIGIIGASIDCWSMMEGAEKAEANHEGKDDDANKQAP